MQQAPECDYYAAEILYIFFENLNIFKWKNSKLEKIYNFHIEIIFIRSRIEELWFFENSVLSRHFRWRDKTELSR
jgi:hypothetical protein